MPTYLIGMGSGSDPTTSTKVKRNILSNDCAIDDPQFFKSDKRSKIIANNKRSAVINGRSNCSPANIIVINGAWVQQGTPTNQNINTDSVDANEVALNNTFANNRSWTIQGPRSDYENKFSFPRSIINNQTMDTSFNYSDDSHASSGDNSSVPFRNFDPKFEDDRDTKSLSWLFNFNIHSLVNPGVKHNQPFPQDFDESTPIKDAPEMRAQASMPQGCDQGGLCATDSKSNTRKFHQQTTLKTPTTRASHGVVMKPPFTYSDLIEKALTETGELTVSELYQWISFNFPFYQPNDDRWKNSVRHNLSINPHFRKGRKSSQGAGHLWSLAPSFIKKTDTEADPRNKKQTSQFVNDIHVVSMEEVEAATASIEEDKENRQLPASQPQEIDPDDVSRLIDCLQDVYYLDPTYYTDMGAKVDEGYSITILSQAEERGLVQSAEEILNGVKKDVEVQYVLPVQGCDIQVVNGTASDFLNPVPVEEVVEECGLGYHLGATGIGADGTAFMITDINPEALGINIVETITPDLFGDSDTIDIS